MKMVIEQTNTIIEIEYIVKFTNEFQALGYEHYKKAQTKSLEVEKRSEEKKLLIEKTAKTLTKIATIISTIAGAIATVIEVLIPIF